jgi:hypothetical protein
LKSSDRTSRTEMEMEIATPVPANYSSFGPAQLSRTAWQWREPIEGDQARHLR